MLDRFELKNGIKVLFVRKEQSIAFAMSVFVCVGSRFDPEEKEGLAHFVEHMMLKRTEKFKDKRDLRLAIDSVGALVDSYTTRELMCFNIRSGILKTEKCVEILSEVVLRASFSAEEVEKERSMIMDEFVENFDDSESRIVDAFDPFYFKGNSLSKSTVGTRESIENIQLKDIEWWYKNYCHPGNILIAVCSHADKKEEVIGCLEKYFNISVFPAVSLRHCAGELACEPFIDKNRKSHIDVIRKKEDQGQLMIAFPGLKFKHKQGVAMWILANMFGGSDSSMLISRLQDDLGITYSMMCYPYSYAECGILCAVTQSCPEKIEDVFREIMTLARDFEKNFTEEDFNIAKQVMVSRLYLMMDDDSLKATAFFGTHAIYGIDTSLEELICMIVNLKKEDILSLAKKTFSQKPVVVAIGPYKRDRMRRRLYSIYKKVTGGKK